MLAWITWSAYQHRFDRNESAERACPSHPRRQCDKHHINTELGCGTFSFFVLLIPDSLLPWKLFCCLTNSVFLPNVQNNQACLPWGINFVFPPIKKEQASHISKMESSSLDLIAKVLVKLRRVLKMKSLLCSSKFSHLILRFLPQKEVCVLGWLKALSTC